MASFEPDDAGMRAIYEELAARVRAVDAKLRAIPLLGQPVDEIKAQAASALATIGVTLPDAELTSYAQSISDGKDFKFNLL